MSRSRLVSLLALAVAVAACAGGYPPTDPNPQEKMARGEGPVATPEHSPGPGDPGVITGALAIGKSFGPGGQLSYEPVALYRDGALMSTVTCDGHGTFMFVAPGTVTSGDRRRPLSRRMGETTQSRRP
jgi:hypothetical protein